MGLLPSWRRNFSASLRRWRLSITRINSAHSSSSGLTGLSASRLTPADAVSTPGQSAKTCSAVGLRRRFLAQINRTLSDMYLLSDGSGLGLLVFLFLGRSLLGNFDDLLAHPAVGGVLVGAFVPVEMGLQRSHVFDWQFDKMQVIAAGKALRYGHGHVGALQYGGGHQVMLRAQGNLALDTHAT